ncbi:MAG: S41 family peptidase [Patescibacteria group bacterium]|nr:S41 family peptidase [Patescibacteria group bacterium]
MLQHFREKYGHRIPLYTAVFIVAAAAGIALFYGGYELGIRHPKVVTLDNVTNTDAKSDITANFGTFWEAWDVMKNEYLKGADLTNQKMVYGAITGLVNSAGDPHTIFLPPPDSVKFQQDVSGNFGGIGAEIGIKNSQLVIIAPLKNNPAEQAGLKAGDAIVAIDGKSTDGIDVNSAVEKIRGEIGTTVTLTIFRDGWDHTKDFKLVRANIQVPTLDTEMLHINGKTIAHISLYAFNENAPLGFYQAALTALFNKSDGIILDLRDNPGGYLEVATNLAGWFVNKGAVVVKERYRTGNEDTFYANGNEALKDVPMVILVNKGSASASEILAGALRAIRGVKLVGTNTYGKGTVQELRTLSDNSQIKLTIANWVLPDDTIISEDGLAPDVEADLSDADIANHNDSQLKAAEDTLLKELGK